MQYLASRYCDRTLQLLLNTFIDIILLRKGPEHVPNAIVVLWFSLGLLVVATLMSAVLVPSSGNDSVVLSFVSSFVGYALYWIVLTATGYGKRFVQTVASLLACGSILTMLMVIAAVILAPIVGGALAGVVVWLILFWSVPVKGHIIARAVDRHWYTGIAIALTIFIMQYISYVAMTGRPAT
jgi:hypothetical protein